MLEPDPVSVLWEAAAVRLLERAYAARGEWVATRISDPTPVQVARMAARGINVLGPDRPSTAARRGGLNARTRWGRGFVRAIYRVNKQYRGRPLEVEVGRALPVRGVVPAGRAVRVRVRRGGQAAMRAVERKPDAQRIWADEGTPAGRWSNPRLRDW